MNPMQQLLSMLQNTANKNGRPTTLLDQAMKTQTHRGSLVKSVSRKEGQVILHLKQRDPDQFSTIEMKSPMEELVKASKNDRNIIAEKISKDFKLAIPSLYI